MSKTTNLGEITWEVSIEREEAARERRRARIDPDKGSSGGQLGENPTGIGSQENSRGQESKTGGPAGASQDGLPVFFLVLPPSLHWEPCAQEGSYLCQVTGGR